MTEAAQSSLSNEMDRALSERALNGGDLRAIPALLERGADVNQTGAFGNTALILAALDGDFALARLLIGKNAALEISNVVGTTALMGAIIKKDKDVLGLLIEAGAGISNGNITYAERMSTREIAQMLREAVETRRRIAAEKAAAEREQARREVVDLKQAALNAQALRRKPKIKASP